MSSWTVVHRSVAPIDPDYGGAPTKVTVWLDNLGGIVLGIAHHDKTLALLADPSSKRWQAAFSYVASLGWCGEHGTDGFVPVTALPFIHGTPATAKLLVTYGFWTEAPGGWRIRNYATRQELAVITAAKKEAQRVASAKANCIRWHGKDCGCWTKVLDE